MKITEQNKEKIKWVIFASVCLFVCIILLYATVEIVLKFNDRRQVLRQTKIQLLFDQLAVKNNKVILDKTDYFLDLGNNWYLFSLEGKRFLYNTNTNTFGDNIK